MTYARVSLAAAIDATRAARDELAAVGRTASEVGATSLSDVLDSAAAQQDKILAELLRQDKRLTTKAEALPGA